MWAPRAPLAHLSVPRSRPARVALLLPPLAQPPPWLARLELEPRPRRSLPRPNQPPPSSATSYSTAPYYPRSPLTASVAPPRRRRSPGNRSSSPRLHGPPRTSKSSHQAPREPPPPLRRVLGHPRPPESSLHYAAVVPKLGTAVPRLQAVPPWPNPAVEIPHTPLNPAKSPPGPEPIAGPGPPHAAGLPSPDQRLKKREVGGGEVFP